MNKFIWIGLAFMAGAVLPFQAGLNFKLGRSIESPIYASMISFLIGMIAVAAYILLTRQSVDLAGFKTAPAYSWLGGVLGAFYVTVVLLAFPRIGPALTFGLVVAGQMIIAVLLDHFNVLVNQPHPITVWRVVGIACITLGVILIRKF
ncbi:MAG TPA: DMT family transporter [Cyclobacteriaceae bacterium]